LNQSFWATAVFDVGPSICHTMEALRMLRST
jgi:hypothetical protein